MKTLLLALTLYVAPVLRGSDHEAVIKWCVSQETLAYERSPGTQFLLEAYLKEQNPEKKAKLYAVIKNQYALAVQAGYNEGLRRLEERNERSRQNVHNMMAAKHFARELALQQRIWLNR